MKVILKQMSKYPIHAVASYVACHHDQDDPMESNDLCNLFTDTGHTQGNESSDPRISEWYDKWFEDCMGVLRSRMIDHDMLDSFNLTIPTVGSYIDYSVKGFLYTPKIKEMLPMDGYPYLKDGIQCGIYMTLGELRNFLDLYHYVRKFRPEFTIKLMIVYESITGFNPTGKINEVLFVDLANIADNDQCDIVDETSQYQIYPVNQNEGDLTDDDHIMFIPLISDTMEVFSIDKYGNMASSISIAPPSSLERVIVPWDYAG